MTVKDIVAAMPSQFNADAAKGMNSVIQFNLSGEGDNAGQYHAIIKDGALEVKEGVHPSPSMTMGVPPVPPGPSCAMAQPQPPAIS